MNGFFLDFFEPSYYCQFWNTMEHLFFDLFLDGLEPITILFNDALGEVSEHNNLYNAN